MLHQQCRNGRNFLHENRLVMRYPLAVPVAQPSVRHNYEMPTAASLARRSTPTHNSALGERSRRTALPRTSTASATANASSEKQIQTDDICDELFLSAALLKCTEHGQSRATQSEGDECSPPLAVGLKHSAGGCLRRATSNFELGRVAEQRAGYQSGGQHTLHRLLGGAASTLPASELDPMDDSWTSDQPRLTPRNENAVDGSSLSSSRSSLARSPPAPVRQVAIPEITDVNQEDTLSARSQASRCSEPSSGPGAPSQAERESNTNLETEEEQQQPPPEQELEHRILLSEAQRIELIKKTRVLRSLLIAEWNRLPLSMFTLRVRNLKHQLEQKLDMVDKDLSVLSQQRVYAKQASSDSYHRFFYSTKSETNYDEHK
ncbi:LOW QUALITY PROTEIN: uncharacterized protein LOC111075048 [Drosophila obscura]|uniref:LOW QUALITY PROTEIN: uncharacterized protein LOC111075048 n=1 Tax=Drosophila obscura TaxID=7282 RepID=UPI001BB295A9|nr:LOW QUALITY PROTEIN: uncharacterized protein LOC111075048 [Drosophila obscura]